MKETLSRTAAAFPAAGGVDFRGVSEWFRETTQQQAGQDRRHARAKSSPSRPLSPAPGRRPPGRVGRADARLRARGSLLPRGDGAGAGQRRHRLSAVACARRWSSSLKMSPCKPIRAEEQLRALSAGTPRRVSHRPPVYIQSGLSQPAAARQESRTRRGANARAVASDRDKADVASLGDSLMLDYEF